MIRWTRAGGPKSRRLQAEQVCRVTSSFSDSYSQRQKLAEQQKKSKTKSGTKASTKLNCDPGLKNKLHLQNDKEMMVRHNGSL